MNSDQSLQVHLYGSIAVTQGDTPGSIAIAAINPISRGMLVKEVDLSALSLVDIEAAFSEQRLLPLPELRDELVQVLAGVRGLQAVSVVPSVFLEANSPIAKGIVLLAAFGFGSLQFGRATVDEVDRLFLGVDPPVIQTKDAPHELPPRIHWAYADSIKAFAEYQIRRSPSGRELAATAAICMSAPGLFYFLTSSGDPQSSQDIVELLASPERMKALGVPSTARIVHGVVSGTEQYSLAATSSTKFGESQRLPLKYALAAKRFEWLEPRHARKLAVLTVCKEWAIRLSCSSLRDEVFAVALIDSLESHANSEDESTRHLAAILKQNHDGNDVAPGFKSAYLLAMYKALSEAGVLQNELELRLLGLGRANGIEHVVYDPDNFDIAWAFDSIRGLERGEA